MKMCQLHWLLHRQCLLCGVQCTQVLLCVAFVVDFVACNIWKGTTVILKGTFLFSWESITNSVAVV